MLNNGSFFHVRMTHDTYYDVFIAQSHTCAVLTGRAYCKTNARVCAAINDKPLVNTSWDWALRVYKERTVDLKKIFSISELSTF